jgi:uncharacterized damage-inducible protein DinB
MTPEQTELLDQYADGAERMAEALRIVPRELLTASLGEGEWTAHQVIVHLADSELVGAGRFRQLVAEEAPALYMYAQEAWATRLGYHATSPEEAVALAAAVRRATATMLRTVAAADPGIWERKATHATRGEMDLERMLRLYIGHVDGHLEQLGRIAQQLGERRP